MSCLRYKRLGSLGALSIACAVCVAACVEPDFGTGESAASDPTRQAPDGATRGPDGSVPGGPPDAGRDGEVLAALSPSWAEPLVGDYAMRLRLFGREMATGIGLSHETLSAVQVRFDAQLGEVVWRARMCRDHAEIVAGLTAGVKYPTLYPIRSQRVLYENGFFKTESMAPTVIGYVEQAPSGCSPGATLPRGPMQSWLVDGTCDCPSDAALPRSPRDCRLTDPDEDGKPGFTVGLTGLYESNDYCVTRDDSQVVHGVIDPARLHRASYRVNQDSYQVQCAQGGCTRASVALCPVDANSLLLAPLPARADGALWSCADMLQVVDADSNGPLVQEPLRFPDRDCP
ncbi:MAG: hypothetical protein JWN48_5293 [Myxococcaceae bacterium]|nr:hypothetical protein [Myxococcaceae bacterium]